MAEQLMAMCTGYGFLCLLGVFMCFIGALDWVIDKAVNERDYTRLVWMIGFVVLLIFYFVRLVCCVQEVLNLGVLSKM